MRISDWSSDVCSADLDLPQLELVTCAQDDRLGLVNLVGRIVVLQAAHHLGDVFPAVTRRQQRGAQAVLERLVDDELRPAMLAPCAVLAHTSEERRVGEEGCRWCMSRWSQYTKK